MTRLRLLEREKRAYRELRELVAQRAAAAQTIDRDFRAGQKAAIVEHEQTLAGLSAQRESADIAADRTLQSTRQTLVVQRDNQSRSIDLQARETIQRISGEILRSERAAQKAIDEARWLAHTVFEASRKRLSQQIGEIQQQLRSRVRTARAIESEAVNWMDRIGHHGVLETVTADTPQPEDAPEDLADAVNTSLEGAKDALQRLRALRLPTIFAGPGIIWAYAIVAILIVPAAVWLAGGVGLYSMLASLVVIAVGGTGLGLWLRRVSRRQTATALSPVLESVRLAEFACQKYLEQEAENYKQRRLEIRQTRDNEYERVAQFHAPTQANCRTRREVELPKLTADAKAEIAAVAQKFEQELRRATELTSQHKIEAATHYEQSLAAAHQRKEQRLAENQGRYDHASASLLHSWQAGFARIEAELTAIRREVSANCPPWNDVISPGWHPPTQVPSAVRFGEIAIDLRGEAGPALASEPEEDSQKLAFRLPALLDFPEGSSVFIKTQGAGRERAVQLMQVMMLRMLTAVPPGKVRLTIIDPVGLGQNFASFMHLADHDEALVGHRIWTEPVQIEQRLADLTEHIETVIQKYLRNEYSTIEAYNEAAGEVAEAFRIVVVANYPAGFTEASALCLLSIAASGPRCGVHILMSVDTKQPAIPGISVADLQKHAVVFSTGDQLVWHDADFKDAPLAVEQTPTDQAKQVLSTVGAAAMAAKRVEVPFEAIAPPPALYWKSDSRRGIDVPLGRAGATRLQHLRLGQGTSQHVLIAGKTGSGKSTLLHALITNAALRYSPDDLELYLIDFKKGVEFKTYVTHELPHARLVAIESEREFGLSVMQRLDAEMRIRGERFRDVGVQDIGAYRDSGQTLPRILFIVDEFQEFFVEDDKVAQEASLLLDRLVRQGRAFGIHVHLGSQTLGGAYTLARTTLGQMAVRIALQCSEADAHLILSEDNAAARLLSRPGEAIYNDANGLVEGNHPFQVVWLPDERRDFFLGEVARMAAEHPPTVRRQQIVFEGTRPADMDKSESLAAILAGAGSGSAAGDGATTGAAATASSPPRVWLGEPLAISAATSVSLPRRGGVNLLWLGQNDEAAAGMMIAALLSLAAQFPAAGSNGHADSEQFTFLAAGPADKEYPPLFRRLPTWLGPRVRIVEAGEVSSALADLAAEVERRQTNGTELPPRFLLVFDLPRWRELRRQEDDFSFSRSAETARRPDQQFADIMREGPALGIHTLLWCDTLTNFQRMLERQTLKEFETRILLQMSPADSSLLIDTGSASTLGRHRALLHREDEGRLEKFRPFSPPSAEWLAAACAQIVARASANEAPSESAAGG